MSVLTYAFAAFIAGILGSVHCIGMCGGIACGVGYLNSDRYDLNQSADLAEIRKRTFIYAVKFNCGRVVTYSLLGALVGFIGHRVSLLDDSGALLSYMRILSAALILLISLKYLFGLPWVDFLERAGKKIWTRINQTFFGSYSLQNAGTFPLGIMWGFIPCGLVYTILASAVASASAVNGMLIMLAFGLGTMPSMLGISAFSGLFRNAMTKRWVQTVFGIALLCLAVLLVVYSLAGLTGHSHSHTSI